MPSLFPNHIYVVPATTTAITITTATNITTTTTTTTTTNNNNNKLKHYYYYYYYYYLVYFISFPYPICFWTNYMYVIKFSCHFFWSLVNILGTHLAETLDIPKLSVKVD